MATYSAQAITTDGLVATVRNAASGDKITPDNNVIIRVTNASGSDVDLTISAYGTTRYGGANQAKVITIATATTRVIPLSFPEYINPADNLISLAWETTPSVTYTVERI
ncbi:hypothetical protein ACFQVD_26470 [Streptosporangium amethystogenes subsp. fukuiense]|uniref:Uncharacterized protein n=1 Tax=Streptosporangium amethystogenes subsp. fukuiense TaxID=698418 RepID=A0ABW2T532_9ACTN